MKMIVCSVYDKATMAYMRPFVAQTAGQATRMFIDECRNPEAPMYAHPEDFALFQVATWTDHDGCMEPMEPVVLQRAHEVTRNVKTTD